MRGTKTSYGDEDYEVSPEDCDRQAINSDKPLSSKYRGVCWNRKNKRWQAAINSGGKYVYLGSFMSEYDAARAFDKAAVKLRGTRAKLNFSYSEYVDEQGNLLEDPKMKNVMYKIEAIQGGAGGGGGGGGSSNHKHDPSGDDANGHEPHLPVPMQGLGHREDGNGGPHSTPPHRQHLSPLGHSGKPQQQQQQGADGTTAQHQPQLELPPPNSAAAAMLFGQCADIHGPGLGQPAFGGAGPLGRGPGVEGNPAVAGLPMGLGSTVSPPTGKAAAGASPLPPRPRLSSHGQATSIPPFGPMSGAPAPPASAPVLSHTTGMSAGPASAGGVGAGPGYDGAAPQHPLHTLGDHTAGGFGAAGAPPARSAPPSAAVQAAIQRELPAGAQVLSYMPNRFVTNKEEICGVLYSDAAWPQQVGVIVWTGSNHIKMGVYDTERDARQAAIKCMQLYCAFCSDEWRVDFFNALTTMGGSAASAGLAGGPAGGHGQHPGREHPADCSGGNLRNGARAAGSSAAAGGGGVREPLPHPLGHPAHAQRPTDQQHGNPAGHNHHNHNQQQQQQQQTGAPYMRTSGNGTPGSAVVVYGAPEYGPAHLDSTADGVGTSSQQGQGQPGGQSSVGDLFQYMAVLGRKTGLGHADRDGAPSDAQGQGTKRGAADEAPRQHPLHDLPEAKRMRVHPGGSNGVSCDTGVGSLGRGPGSEVRAAHKLPLDAIVKQLEQAAAGR